MKRKMMEQGIFVVRSLVLAALLTCFATTVAFGQETYKSATIGILKTLTGQIKWKKTLGTIPSGPGKKDAHANPCSPFFVAVTDYKNDYPKVSWFDNSLTWVAREGEYNICKYEMMVPPDIQLLVQPGIGSMDLLPKRDRTSYIVKEPWVGGERIRQSWTGELTGPAPGAGYDRNFTPAFKFVTISAKGMYLSFEMTYSQIIEGQMLPRRQY